MFTGIITDIGKIIEISEFGDKRIKISTKLELDSNIIGASIACSGACLTIVNFDGNWFEVDVSSETLSKTIIGKWKIGSLVNLEKSLRLGDELSGHMVTGHVDGLALLVDKKKDGDSIRLDFQIDEGFERFIASKGSVCLDGVSLTVNEVNTNIFSVNIIRHTQLWTTLDNLETGDVVNLEIDLIARYLDKLKN